METQEEVKELMDKIKNPSTAVGIDPVYVHAIVINRLTRIESKLKEIEQKIK